MIGKLTSEKILKKMIKDVKKTLKVKNVPEVDFVKNLGVSSIKVFEIFLKFEQSFKVCFDENEITLENLNNLQELSKLIFSKKINSL